jgi:hypothetical protein
MFLTRKFHCVCFRAAVFVCIIGAATVRSAPNFQIIGPHIYDPDGKLWVPVGGNMNGYRWCWPNKTLPHVDVFTEGWNFNCIRLNGFIKGYHTKCKREGATCSAGDGTGVYKINNDLDSIIDAYTSRNVVVMIEGHDWTGGADSEKGKGRNSRFCRAHTDDREDIFLFD